VYQERIDAKKEARRCRHCLAKLYQDHDRVPEALDLFRADVAEDAKDAVAWYGIGVCLMKTDKLDDAIVHFRRAFPLSSSVKGTVALDLGSALLERSRRMEKSGRPDEARRTAAEGHWYRGYGLAQQGKHAEALAAYRQALDFPPNLHWAYANA